MEPVLNIPPSLLDQIEALSQSPDEEFAELLESIFRRIEHGAWRDREGVLRVMDALLRWDKLSPGRKTVEYWQGYAEASNQWMSLLYFLQDQAKLPVSASPAVLSQAPGQPEIRAESPKKPDPDEPEKRHAEQQKSPPVERKTGRIIKVE